MTTAPYPPRPQLKPLPRFEGTAAPRPDADLLADLTAFVLSEYAAGRSLRQIAELTDRSHSAVRNLLERRGVLRRAVGAPVQHGSTGVAGRRRPAT